MKKESGLFTAVLLCNALSAQYHSWDIVSSIAVGVNAVAVLALLWAEYRQ
ncbi:MAG: hypothetical protein RR384_08125 [Acidaminococcaceae bacterium]